MINLLRPLTLSILILFINSCNNFAQKKIGQVNIDKAGTKMPYRVTLPDNFSDQRTYPVLIAPGEGTLYKDYNLFFGDTPSQHGWILIESLAILKGPNAMKALLEKLKAQYQVEGFHLLGFSANSAGQFEVALAMPDSFESIVAIPGHPRTQNKNQLQKLKNVKVQFIVGENDGWWKKQALNYQKILQSLGVDIRLKVVPKGGHVLVGMAGDPLFKVLNQLR